MPLAPQGSLSEALSSQVMKVMVCYMSVIHMFYSNCFSFPFRPQFTFGQMRVNTSWKIPNRWSIKFRRITLYMWINIHTHYLALL